MGSALHFILLLSGLWTFTMGEYHQFYVVNTELNWTDAQAYCRAIFTDLATIESDEEMNTVKAMINGSGGDFWIGMRQIDSNCYCSASYNNRSWVWSDQSCVSYFNWKDGEPNNAGTNNCVTIRDNNKWNDAGCFWTYKFVCYKKRTPLIVIKEEKTWKEALRFCRQNHVDLVSVQSQEMQNRVEVVTQNVSTNVPSRVWIGLRHTCAQGLWYWVAGEPICYQNWAPGNGTGVEDCGDGERTGAMLSDSKKWISLPETQKLPFICVTF
ncbi:C-type mannose receptor 2-like isoform 2-T4 [Clarias gariepinus]